MAGFDRFLKIWSSLVANDPPSDAEADAGFDYMGDGPPTVEQFDAIQRWNDEKDNWLYSALAAVFARAGLTPASATPALLGTAVQHIAAGNRQVFTSNGNFVVPAGVTRIFIEGWAGGGGSGASSGYATGTSGGAGGGYGSCFVTVVPGAVIPVVVATGGVGGIKSGASASAGGTGGITAFGTHMSIPGGGGSPGGAGVVGIPGGVPGAAPTFGGWTSGTFGLAAFGGGAFPIIFETTAWSVLGGIGSDSPFGGSSSPPASGTGASPVPHSNLDVRASFPGGGATGSPPDVNGYTGASGLLIVRW